MLDHMPISPNLYKYQTTSYLFIQNHTMSLALLATSTITSSSTANPLRSNARPRSKVHVGKGTAYTSCEQKQGVEGEKRHTVDRRNVLLGIGGLYGATAAVGNQAAVGAPVSPPDFNKCHPARDGTTEVKFCIYFFFM